MKKTRTGVVILLVLFLVPQAVDALGMDLDLRYREFYAAFRDTGDGWRIEGFFTASDSVEFFICDEDNYYKWIWSQNAVMYDHHELTTSHTFNFTVPHDAVWYVIILNAHTANNSLEGELYYIDQSNTIQLEVNEGVKGLISAPLFLIFVLAVAVASIVGVWWARRREPFPAVRYDEILRGPGRQPEEARNDAPSQDPV
ncbi:MAG: hypothetical protein ACE5H4_15900 [Candidatus Thorarchaeota archaeon]